MTPQPGEQIGNYRVLGVIGRGAYAQVYAAEHRLLGQVVAIKLLHEELCSDVVAAQRLVNEARVVAQLHHPGIVVIHDIGELAGGRLYVVMERLEGRTLERQLQDGPMSWRAVALLGRQMAHALGAAHARGIVHRDLKPGNVFLMADPEEPLSLRSKLLDFGIAKFVQGPASGLTATGLVVGTPAYMSPEQCLAVSGLDARSDVYSLGAVLFEMVTGRPAFVGLADDQLLTAHVQVPVSDPREHVPELPAELAEVILRCLRKNPGERYRDGAQVAAELQALRAAPATAVPLTAPTSTLRRAAGRRDDGVRHRPGHDETLTSDRPLWRAGAVGSGHLSWVSLRRGVADTWSRWLARARGLGAPLLARLPPAGRWPPARWSLAARWPAARWWLVARRPTTRWSLYLLPFAILVAAVAWGSSSGRAPAGRELRNSVEIAAPVPGAARRRSGDRRGPVPAADEPVLAPGGPILAPAAPDEELSRPLVDRSSRSPRRTDRVPAARGRQLRSAGRGRRGRRIERRNSREQQGAPRAPVPIPLVL
jgi:tRNA A-37 threonylcarbamoyl transferase component Bud32